MIFKQLFDTKSSTYTYLISSGKGREALIIDPVIENVTGYVNLLKSLNLKLDNVKLEFDYLSSPENLISYQNLYFENKLTQKSINEIKIIDFKTEKILSNDVKIIDSER